GQTAHVEPGAPEGRGVHRSSLGEEALGDSSLIEQLDGAGMDTATPRPCEFLRFATFEYDDVRAGQAQLPRQHHSRRPAADHYDLVHVRPLSTTPDGQYEPRVGACDKPPPAR